MINYNVIHQQWKQVSDDGSNIETTIYAAGVYEQCVHSSDTEYRHCSKD